MEGIWLMYQLMRESWQAVIDGGLFLCSIQKKSPGTCQGAGAPCGLS